jgi:cytochrome c oxidase subunit 2
MALLLALVVAIITLLSIYGFMVPGWHMPPYISEYGEAYDSHFALTLAVMGIIFFLAQMGLAFVVFRFRDQGARAGYSHGNTKLEITWTTATAIIFVGLVLIGMHIWAQAHVEAPRADALKVELWGQQFSWYARYAGPDGQFGRTVPELMKESAGNPLGLDPDDPASRDDVIMPVIAIPVNRQIDLILHSKDVTHNFFVRELRLKQDVVPGLVTNLHFTVSKIGDYEVPCSELCGLGHYQMRTFLQVKSQEDFDQWLRDNAPQQ